jgi:hypothetical protein
MVKSRSAGNPPGKAGFLFLGCAFWVSALASKLFVAVRARVYAARECRDKPQKLRGRDTQMKETPSLVEKRVSHHRDLSSKQHLLRDRDETLAARDL